MNNLVCIKEDDYVFEQPRWLAHLSNGEVVIQDDGRPGLEIPQAWIRLGNYCRQNNLDIVNLSLQFRSHHQSPLPANAEGYYFINKVITIDYNGPTMGFYLIGFLKESKIFIQEWKIPELICTGEDIRSVEQAGQSLIRRVNDTKRIFDA